MPHDFADLDLRAADRDEDPRDPDREHDARADVELFDAFARF